MCIAWFRDRGLYCEAYERRLTLGPGETSIQECRNQFPTMARFPVQIPRALENVVDGLGIHDPQAAFLHDNISVSIQPHPTLTK